MFWGLTVEPGKCYNQTVEKSFHISMACLQPEKCKDSGYLSFILKTAGKEFVLCNLQRGSVDQIQLDLNFNAGDEITFTTSGAKNTIHLSGYLITDEEVDDDMFMDSDSEIDADDLKELAKKRKNILAHGGPGKVPKLELMEGDDGDDNEEDDDDSSDDALEKLEAIEEGDEDSDEEDSDEEGEEEEEEEVEVKPIATKKKKNTPTTPDVQTNGNGPASGKKNKKGKETPANNANTPNAQKSPKNQNAQNSPASATQSKKTIEGGVVIEDSKVGNGAVAKPGSMVKVYYTGRLKSNNKQFDATTSGKPFGFRLGRGEVIRGWDIGVAGMKIGGKRKITIPAALGYGTKGAPPSIPPNSILMFEVELKGVQ